MTTRSDCTRWRASRLRWKDATREGVAPPSSGHSWLSATLRNRDGGVVAVGGDGKGPGAAGGVGIGKDPRRRAARGRCRNVGNEGSGRLSEAIGRLLSQIGESRRQRPHVSGENAHCRPECPRVGLGLGHAGAGLDVGVERDRDGRENANDGHHDHQLDEREAGLATQTPPPLLMNASQHMFSPLLERAIKGPKLKKTAFETPR